MPKALDPVRQEEAGPSPLQRIFSHLKLGFTPGASDLPTSGPGL